MNSTAPRLTLSDSEQRRLQEATRALVSPLAREHFPEWAAEACRSVMAVLEADKASAVLPHGDSHLSHTENVALDIITKFPERIASYDAQFSLWRKSVTRGVWCRGDLFPKEMYESAYYNEVIVPHQAFDAVGLTVPAPGGAPFPTLMFYHDSPTGPRFGARGLALLRLLYPAFQAGVGTYLRLAEKRAVLTRTLDELAEGLLLCDASGAVLHRNTALEALLARDPERQAVFGGMQQVARALSCLLCGAAKSQQEGDRRVQQEVRTAAASYRVRGSLVEAGLLGSGPALLVSLERTTPEPPTPESLRERYGLTKKEVQVALLLAQGRSNEEIAKALFISPHTARRHTEQVMLKVQVKSRAEVAGKILRS